MQMQMCAASVHPAAALRSPKSLYPTCTRPWHPLQASQAMLAALHSRRWLPAAKVATGQGHCSSRAPSPTTDEDLMLLHKRLGAGDKPHTSTGISCPQAPCNPLQQVPQLRSPKDVMAIGKNILGSMLYTYFNWRQDTSRDLLVTFLVFACMLLAGGGVRRYVVDDAADLAVGNLWADVYQVCQWVFGQNMPGASSALGQQVLSVTTAMVGLAAFAVVLALVERVVLETLQTNVERGSAVFESGHVLVLGWCVSQRDIEVVRKVVQQLCVARGCEGNRTIVVMTQRSKLDMEEMFRRCLPQSQRFGTNLVFRKGSPLLPSDLEMVAAHSAAATIVVSDQSRSADEADAQATRCAILLEELFLRKAQANTVQTAPRPVAAATTQDSIDGRADLSGAGGQVVVELKTVNALPLIKFACKPYSTLPLPTGQLNAQRLAKMVKRPIISIISQQLFNFENGVSLYVHHFPQLAGTRFGDLAYLFPDGIVMGMVDKRTGTTRMAPSIDCPVPEDHALVICRSTSIRSDQYHPCRTASSKAALKVQESLATWSGPSGRRSQGGDNGLNRAQPLSGSAAALLTAMASSSLEGSCGLVAAQQSIRAGSTAVLDRCSLAAAGLGITTSSGSPDDSSDSTGSAAVFITDDRPVLARSVTRAADASVGDGFTAGTVSSAAVQVPPEYFGVNDKPVCVCVLGWGPNCLMNDLIKELDHGVSKLPRGSEVDFVNMHNPHDSLGPVLQHVGPERIKVRHVAANPLQRSSLGAALDVSKYNCVMVLFDQLWVDTDNDDTNGLESLDEPSVLRLDSLVMVAQLNMRKLRQEAVKDNPAINFVCQKVGTEGLTCFEDRQRPPLGISVNFNSYSAKMLAQLGCQPLMMDSVTRLGEDAVVTIAESSKYAAVGEEISFWQLVARVQTTGGVLLGYYEIPVDQNTALAPVINPIGHEVRNTPRVWNRGDSNLLFILLKNKMHTRPESASGSYDLELENTKQAGWVAARDTTPHASTLSHSHPNSLTDMQ